MRSRPALFSLLVLVRSPLLFAEPPQAPAPERTLYVIGTAHLDTQWRWTVQDTIDDFLPATLRDNFALFEKYPGYVFSFEGAFRYALMKEYYPAEYERLRAYVRAGRWKVAGSWVDAVDPNVPSPESLIRHALYGNGFFRRELGVTSRDVYLPDCFGFGFALPSIAAHSGLVAFSTQKLTWGSSIKIPFDVGLWEGVDGSTLIAALNPGDYASQIKGNLTLDPDVYATIDRQAAMSGLPTAFRYFGTGDIGMAPDEASVANLEKSLQGPGPLRVFSSAPDQLARDLMARGDGKVLAGLPRYRGEFLLTSHGAGCYTSQAAMKRYNRRSQRLAAAAEGAAVAAAWLGGTPYPRETLREAWTRVLWHQFHDDLTGTSIPEAYVFSWNDEAIAANQFGDVLATSAGSVSRVLDTRGEGIPLVVFNSLGIAREDVVEGEIRFEGGAPDGVWVIGPDGRDVPAQIEWVTGSAARIVFLADVPSLSFSVFRILPSKKPPAAGELSVSAKGLENARYRVALNDAGDVASIFDKSLNRELLSAPLALQLIEDEPRKWAAWEVEYGALMAPPREVVGGPAAIRVVERGPAQATLEVVRRAAGSTFTQQISLAAGGAGSRVEIATDVDWRTKGTLLKASFSLAATNRNASYDLGLGVAERPTNRPNLYEVPAQQWADLTDTSGSFGVAILNDSRHGWDKPDEKTLRLSLVHTPRVIPSWSWIAEQASNDIGRHRVVMAVTGHAGTSRSGVSIEADRLNQPLVAFQAPRHDGALGNSFSLLRLEGPGGSVPPVAVHALKRAEESDEVVVRLQELSGKAVDGVTLRFPTPVLALRELNGAEEPLGPNGTGGAFPEPSRPALALKGGIVSVSFAPFRPRTLAVTLGPAPAVVAPPAAVPVDLPYDLDGISRDEDRRDGDFDGRGHSLAGELLPATVVSGGIPLRTGSSERGRKNVLVARGQTLSLPAGNLDRVYLLAAAVGGDRSATFAVDGVPVVRTIPDWAEPVGQWNSRLVGGERQEDPAKIAPAYEKDVPVAWIGTHRHGPRGENEAYVFTHLFRIRIDLPRGARDLTLPKDDRIRILAATAVAGPNDDAVLAGSLTEPATATLVHVDAPEKLFLEKTSVTLTSPTPGATIRFTLDGSEPGATSAVYSAPLVLERTATVKARAFARGLDDRFVASATVTKTTPRASVSVPAASLAPGLFCNVYEGEWRKLPDFDALKPTRTLTMKEVGIPTDRPKGHFGLVCEGFVSVPAEALYTFSLRSRDASELRLDGKRAILNDQIDFVSRRSELALRPGLHRVELRWFQSEFMVGLELKMDAPGKPLEPISADRLFHLPVVR
ncbi:MAG: glycoside hydrolase family 38 C-terminal domain-containing protein [Thermoanaerobaculia bacterium]